MKILITGSAGFIGFYLAEKPAPLGHLVTSLENINDYYDIKGSNHSRNGFVNTAG